MSEIKDLRTRRKLTQQQVADLVGISVRSYKSYENDPSKVGSLKYNYILDKLNELYPVDEDHGILDHEYIVQRCTDVLSDYPVKYCILFGSYAKGEAKETSDVDLLVVSDVKGIKFYEMTERLRETLNKRVDVLDLNQLKDNLDLVNEILRDGIRIYEQQ
ncbi:hypothetical protein SAMN06296952_2059 [Oscillospiraceae bacterium]|nr:hypothetical protein SAMN06296952_2059 [Oscillospiraceae bacterium]